MRIRSRFTHSRKIMPGILAAAVVSAVSVAEAAGAVTPLGLNAGYGAVSSVWASGDGSRLLVDALPPGATEPPLDAQHRGTSLLYAVDGQGDNPVLLEGLRWRFPLGITSDGTRVAWMGSRRQLWRATSDGLTKTSLSLPASTDQAVFPLFTPGGDVVYLQQSKRGNTVMRLPWGSAQPVPIAHLPGTNHQLLSSPDGSHACLVGASRGGRAALVIVDLSGQHATAKTFLTTAKELSNACTVTNSGAALLPAVRGRVSGVVWVKVGRGQRFIPVVKQWPRVGWWSPLTLVHASPSGNCIYLHVQKRSTSDARHYEDTSLATEVLDLSAGKVRRLSSPIAALADLTNDRRALAIRYSSDQQQRPGAVSCKTGRVRWFPLSRTLVLQDYGLIPGTDNLVVTEYNLSTRSVVPSGFVLDTSSGVTRSTGEVPGQLSVSGTHAFLLPRLLPAVAPYWKVDVVDLASR